MPRMLSNLEYVTFLDDVDVSQLNLPPWGGIVEWGGLKVLIFIKTTGEVMLTDVSDLSAQWQAQATKQYVPAQDVFFYSLPESFLSSLADAARAAGQVLQTTTAAIGAAAGGITGPVVGQLTLPVIALGLLALIYFRGKS